MYICKREDKCTPKTKTRMRRILFYLALTLCITASTYAYAYDFEADGIYYNILSEEERTCEVTHCAEDPGELDGTCYAGNITIPASVTHAGTTYSVTSIGDQAFYECWHLTSVVIPSSVTSIKDFAFFGCDVLTSVSLTNSVTHVGIEAFCGCDHLSAPIYTDKMFIYLPGTHKDEYVIPSGIEEICGYAFYSNQLPSVVIPNSVTTIGADAFEGCHGLRSITIPSSVKTIGDGAFSWTGLKTVTIPGTLTSVSSAAFAYCPHLTSVTLQEGVEEIGEAAFYCCEELVTVNMPHSLKKIGDQAFSDCYMLKALTLPAGLEHIGAYAFAFCRSLLSVTNLAPQPQSITRGVFGLPTDKPIAEEAVLHVMPGCRDAYQNAEGWKDFKSIVEDAASTTSITTATPKVSSATYDLQGRCLPATPRRGLYIKDGRKIVVR